MHLPETSLRALQLSHFEARFRSIVKRVPRICQSHAYSHIERRKTDKDSPNLDNEKTTRTSQTSRSKEEEDHIQAGIVLSQSPCALRTPGDQGGSGVVRGQSSAERQLALLGRWLSYHRLFLRWPHEWRWGATSLRRRETKEEAQRLRCYLRLSGQMPETEPEDPPRTGSEGELMNLERVRGSRTRRKGLWPRLMGGLRKKQKLV